MKKYLLLSLAFMAITLLQAQAPLKGTIKYDIKFDLPEKDRQQMEQFGFSMPNSSVILSNGSQVRMKMLTAKGVFTEFLTTEGQVYLMDKVDKVAYKMPIQENKAEDQKWVVTKTEEFETILGKKCRKYVVESEDKKTKQYIWASPEYKISNRIFSNINMRTGGQASFYDEIDGIPFKMIMGEGDHKMEMKVISFSATPPAETEFKLPSDYTIETFNAMSMAKIMMRGK
jgi:hypothetical protein